MGTERRHAGAIVAFLAVAAGSLAVHAEPLFVAVQAGAGALFVAQEKCLLADQGLEDPAALAKTLEGMRIYGREANEASFGTAQDPGPIYDTAQEAIDVWSRLGVLRHDILPADVIGHGVREQ